MLVNFAEVTVPSFIDTVDFTPIQAMAEALAVKAVPVVIAVLVVFVGIKLIKRFGNKVG